MSASSLQAIDISVEFSGLRALDGVSLCVDPGEILGLIGPNGSGKTTLVNAVTGQVPLATGRVLVNGTELTGFKPNEIALKGVARSFQIARLFDNLTVEENIAAAALAQHASRRAVRKIVAALLEEFGLTEEADELTVGLSYGTKRHVEIARALAASPRFLLLDEPAAGMNESESDALLALLAILPQERDLGLLIIDHDMSLIMRLCHRLHVLASGRTIAEGDVASVRTNPAVIEAYLGSVAETDDA